MFEMTEKLEHEQELSIILAPEQAFYLSGGQVEGYIQYKSPGIRSVKGIEVKFWGRLKSTIVEKHPLATIYRTYRDRVWLFEESKDVFSGNETSLQPGTHAWSFTFTIPTSVEPRKVEAWDIGPVLERFPPQPLPPSSHLNARVKGVISGYYSIISYAIVAKLHFTDSALPTPEAQVLLTIIPVASSPPAKTEHEHQLTHEIRGFDLLPPAQRPQKALTFQKPPTLRLRLTAAHPIYLVPTQPWRVHITLHVLPSRPHDGPVIPDALVPSFCLRSLHARLKCKTTVAITRTAEHSRTHASTAAEARLFNQGLIVPGEEKAVDMGALPYLPASTALSSLSRRYVLRLTAVVESSAEEDGGQQREFELKGDVAVVVGALPAGKRAETVEDMVRGGVAMAALDDVGGVLDVGLGIWGLVSI
ncbi:hypothetical protein B0J12DRAFT_669265 [Macrophomina phaseolina]|uniref:Arrestin-like protein n=1 Tax=Macrophomina phaseolina TaxID=35725 RepID=A0ABQ8G653_9PEZI|nr:hypothetical protein B0J12DRAFT_669265 [Macrophomina phaseolina]